MGIRKVFIKAIIILSGSWLIAGIGYSQNLDITSKEYQFPGGSWIIQEYGDIIKYTLVLKNRKDEQVSNAVIMKPSAFSPASQHIEYKSGSSSIKIDSQIELLNYFDSAGHRGFRFLLQPDEKIFGTGERAVPLDRRGYKLNLYNQPNYGYGVGAENLNYSVPFIISSAGYGLFFDNPSKGYLDIGKTNNNVLEYGASSGELTFYVIPGENVKTILQKYYKLTGTQPIPARWVMGNLMSRFGYRSEQQLTAILNKMQQENFPVDAVILDLFWFGDSIKGTMGNLDWVNKKAWPDPERMIKGFKKQGVNTILITEPYVLNSTPNYISSKRFHATDSLGNPYLINDFYFGQAGLLDIFRNDAQDWFWNKYKMQIKKGVAGWWGDLGEPERHPAEVYHNLKDLGFKKLFPANAVHNIYGHYWDKMLFDRYAKEYPEIRLFNLNRSGYAGSPRYGVFPWSGDVGRNWSGLQAQLPVMLGMSMSGVPYIHADAGGFALGDLDPELYTRWIQFAVFTPVLRPHGTALGDLAPEVKDIPSEGALYDDPQKSIVRKYIQLRYQLLPYNYTLAYDQAQNGEALVRPMFYESAADTNLFRATDQFMWGNNLLVAPVIEQAAANKKIYLPEGYWYEFFSDKIYNGAEWITEPVTINDIPVFVKAGSFIPMFIKPGGVKNTSQYTGKDIVIKYYPSNSKSSYTLFHDDGHTNNTLQTGNYELIKFTGLTAGNIIKVEIQPSKGKPRVRNLKLILPAGMVIKNVRIDNKVAQISDNEIEIKYKGRKIHIEVIMADK